jgi:hypothetical protein
VIFTPSCTRFRLSSVVLACIMAAVPGCISAFVLLALPVKARPGSQTSQAASTVARSGSATVNSTAADCSEPVRIFDLTGAQGRPRVAYDPDDAEYLVVWEDSRNGRSDIYGRFMQEGCPYGGSIGLTTVYEDTSADNFSQTLPDAVYNPDLGRYFVIWHDEQRGVVGRHLSRTGGLEPEQVFFFNGPGKVFTNSAVTYDADNAQYFLVTEKIEGGNHTIRLARVLAADLSRPFNEQISPTTKDRQLGDVAHNPGPDTNLAVWVDLANGSLDVYAQGFDQAGSRTPDDEFAIAVANAAQVSPALDFSAQCDGYLLVWEDGRHGASDIFRIPLSATFVPELAEELEVLVTPSQIDGQPTLAASSAAGEYLVVWEAQDAGALHANLLAQRVDCTGAPLAGQDPVAVTRSNEHQSAAAVAYLAQEQKYLLVWSGREDGSDEDIFARVVDLAHSPPTSTVYLPLVQRTVPPACIPDPPGESDNVPDALLICSGQTVTGQVSDDDLDDVYKIVAVSGDRLTVSLSGSGPGDADLYLFPPATGDVTVDPWWAFSANPGNQEFLSERLTAGVWYIDIYFDPGGPVGVVTYDVTVSLAPDSTTGTTSAAGSDADLPAAHPLKTFRAKQ